MLIRSQDKTALVKFENIVINLKLPESLKVICWSLQDAQRSGGYFVLGEYSTKEKAMKVLDMIQEAYSENEALKTISTGALTTMLTKDYATTENVDSDAEMLKNYTKIMKKSAVFQMPYDSEVEV